MKTADQRRIKASRPAGLGSKCLGVIVPVFNEAPTIDEILTRVLAQPCVREVIVVDDGSSDGTGELLRAWPARDERVRILGHSANQGKGAAIRTGLAAATADVVVIQDGDLEYNPQEYSILLEPILKGEADVVYGSRFASAEGGRRAFWHTLGNRCLTWCSNVAFGLRLTDVETCYKMFRRTVLDRVELQEDRFGFCPEVTAKVAKLGIPIRELPVSYYGRTWAQGKKIRARDGLNALRCITRYCALGQLMGRLGRGALLFAWEPLAYSFGLLVVCGVIPAWGQWYSVSVPFRLQTAALLHGELTLSHDVHDLAHDLAWSHNGVNQVWGLGIPLWRLPFECIARLFGHSAFPDRIALGLFMAVVACVVLRTWLVPAITRASGPMPGGAGASEWNRIVPALGTVGLLLLFPPIVTLLRSRMMVYEEVMVYVYFYGIGLLCGLVALRRNPVWWRFYGLCAIAGLGGMIRPTLVFYAGATILMAAWTMVRPDRTHSGLDSDVSWRCSRKKVIGRLCAGGLVALAGGAMLFVTNLARFGNGFEFGHRLNLQGGTLLPSVFSTRFDYPFGHASALASLRELFGALFQIRTFNGADYYRQAFFPGQSDTFRWREFSFGTYDFSYAILLAAACVVGAWTGWKLLWKTALAQQAQPSKIAVRTTDGRIMGLWGIGACIPLALFYMKTPAIAERYMLDFAPAFVAILGGAWCWLADEVTFRGRRPIWRMAILWLAFLSWQGLEIGFSKTGAGTSLTTGCDDVSALCLRAGNQRAQAHLPERYELGAATQFCKVPFNGEGWDVTTGRTKAAIELFIEDPKCLVLNLAPSSSKPPSAADYECISAKIGLEKLKRQAVRIVDGGATVIFRGPNCREYQKGVQIAFLGMVRAEDLGTGDSTFRLLRVQWRGELEEEQAGAEARIANEGQ